jgi:hypothetical protein
MSGDQANTTAGEYCTGVPRAHAVRPSRVATVGARLLGLEATDQDVDHTLPPDDFKRCSRNEATTSGRAIAL